MVPWHLKPKYSPITDCNQQKRRRKPRKKKKPAVKNEHQYVKTGDVDVLDEGTIDSLYQDTSHDQSHDTSHHQSSLDQPEDNGDCITEILNNPSQKNSNNELNLDPPCEADHTHQLEKEGYVTYHRYYHVFCEGELKRLCLKLSDIVTIVDDWYDHENWCIIVEKKNKINHNFN